MCYWPAACDQKFNDVIGRLFMWDDITERLELEAQLEHAEKLSAICLLCLRSWRMSQPAAALILQLRADANQAIMATPALTRCWRKSRAIRSAPRRS